MLKHWWKPLLFTLAISTSQLGQLAAAHVVWFDYEDGAYNLVFGHPEEEAPEPLEIDKFQEATAYSASKSLVDLETIETARSLSFVGEDVAALTAFYDNGFWQEFPDGSYANISAAEAEATDYANVTSFLKYTKGIYAWSEAVAEPFGLPLEIMPLTNPLEVGSGENLPIQVLFEGEAIASATVEYLGETLSVANDGTYLVPVSSEGLAVIEASYDDPTATNPAVSYATTLSAEEVSATTVPEPSALLGLSFLGLVALARNHWGKR